MLWRGVYGGGVVGRLWRWGTTDSTQTATLTSKFQLIYQELGLRFPKDEISKYKPMLLGQWNYNHAHTILFTITGIIHARD